MYRINPLYRLGLFDGFDIEIDHNRFPIAADKDTFENLLAAGIDLLMWHERRDIYEVAGSCFGGELQLLSPAHAGTTFDYVDHALKGPMMMCSRFGIGMYVDCTGPQLLGSDTRKVDGSLAVHARCLSSVGIQGLAWNDPYTIMLPPIVLCHISHFSLASASRSTSSTVSGLKHS
jgi:hypothetical protein